MAKTNAERQRDWRQRRASAISDAEAGFAVREKALADECERLRAEVEYLRGALDEANAEIGRLSGPECQHPAEGMNGTYCTGCKTDLW